MRLLILIIVMVSEGGRWVAEVKNEDGRGEERLRCSGLGRRLGVEKLRNVCVTQKVVMIV